MGKRLVWFFGIIFVIAILLGAGFFLFVFPIYIKDVSYEVKDKQITTHLTFSSFFVQGECEIEGVKAKIEHNSCTILIPNGLTDVKVTTPWNTKTIKLDPKVDEVLDFELEETKLYLAVGEKRKLGVSVDQLGSPNIVPSFTSKDENILKIEDGLLVGNGNGVTTVSVQVGNILHEATVTVSDLYHTPLLELKKEYMKCGIYNEEQNKLLDEVLSYKINKAGYQTRAGVVAALRFLTLEFPYQLNYFFENGRINNNTGGAQVDGEGRFYHKGLYLNSYKFNELTKYPKSYGPATWGCPLTNWQDESGFHPGVKYPNGLDCSGFITWAMFNGGFDPKDTGAGDNPETTDDLSDLGTHILITRELLNSHVIKAGDIIATDGHIAMVGGITNDTVYVAESTTYYHGVVMHPYTYDELLATDYLTYVINMDDYYKTNGQGEGNYTAYWE